MSLREAGGSLAPRHRRRRESRSAESGTDGERTSESRRRRTRDGSRPSRAEEGPRRSADQLQVDGDRRRRRRSESRHRQVEHQSSLRSLIGSADMSERDIEREIEDFARQIQEEGLLEGLDLDNIDLTRDDELSRRITESYRRRQRDRSRQESSRRSPASTHSGTARYSDATQPDSRHLVPNSGSRASSRPRPHSRSTSTTSQAEDRSRPPPSMSATLEVQNPARRTRRRTASTGRSATTPSFPSPPEPRPAARSQTDLTLRTQTTESPAFRPSISEGRSSSTPSMPSSAPPPPPTDLSAETSSNNASFASRVPQGNPAVSRSSTPPEAVSSGRSTATHRSSTPPEVVPAGRSTATHQSSTPPESVLGRSAASHRPADLAIVHSAVASPMSSPTTPGHQRTRSQLFPEPSIACSRCQRPHIEYEVHYNCVECAAGQWNLCLDCYRRGKGCLYWFGFGYGAWNKWDKARQQDSSIARPHMLTASRYLPPPSAPGGADGRKTLTTDDPKKRLETGTFCARCFTWTNDCYWRCDTCNEGDWGFCNNCVNQGRSCSHMLLPLTHEATRPPSSSPNPQSPGRPPTASILTGPQASSIGPFKPLTFTTRCDVCQDAIPPAQVRYHCFSCTSSLVPDATPGDYDICTPCYHNLMDQGQISPENGYSGWRRCLKGHRMAVVGFTDGNIGQWRYVDRDLVGGRALWIEPFVGQESQQGRGLQKWTWRQGKQECRRLATNDVSETAPTSDGTVTFAPNFPPDGGTGAKGQAGWSWYPEMDVKNELLFPRGAEIREIRDMNGDWFFGTYMDGKAIFPAQYVVIDQGQQPQ